MLSQQHKLIAADTVDARPRAANAIAEERILDAAYDLLLAIGMRRLTMADIARRAGISRATLYRRWPNVQAVVASLVTREFASVTRAVRTGASAGRAGLVTAVVGAVVRLRSHPLLRKIIDVDPEFLMPYLVMRRGSSADVQLALVEAGIRDGQADGSIRRGDATAMAQAVVLTAWSFTLTGPVFAAAAKVPAGAAASASRDAALAGQNAELTAMLERYLAP